jgi:hypothetical protein
MDVAPAFSPPLRAENIPSIGYSISLVGFSAKSAGIDASKAFLHNGKDLARIHAGIPQILDGLIEHCRKDLF